MKYSHKQSLIRKMNEPYKSDIQIGDKVLTISGLLALYLDACAMVQ